MSLRFKLLLGAPSIVLVVIACGDAKDPAVPTQSEASPSSAPPIALSLNQTGEQRQISVVSQKLDAMRKMSMRLASETIPLLRDHARACAIADQDRFQAEIDSQAKTLIDADKQAAILADILDQKRKHANAREDDKDTPHLRDIEARTDELDDQIRRTHTRIALLSDTIGACTH